MKSGRMKRGVAARRLVVLEELRFILGMADLSPKRMVRAVAAHLAIGGDYCIADMIEPGGSLRRLEIAHADPSRRERLRVTADETHLARGGRVATLLASGGAEVVPRLTRAAAARASDIVLLQGETFGSYMSASIMVSGAPMVLLTVVACQNGRQFDADELGFLKVVGEWTGLGLENALRRELHPHASVPPPSAAFPSVEPASGRTRIVRAR